MTSAYSINKCIQDCKETAAKLRSQANSESDTQVKMSLIEGAHHLDLCVTECEYSVKHMGA